MADPEIKMYLLNETTVETLGEVTGLGTEAFENMLAYDKAYALRSKVYVFPETDKLINAKRELDKIWDESQGDKTVIRDAGIMQEIVNRLRVSLGWTEYG